MSEFKFSCPACNQNVLCDTVLAGTQLTCPHCNVSIVVPKSAAASAPPNLSPGTPGNINPAVQPAAPGVQRTSGLAIASLICSLASLVTCVGWLPGIICGHLAKSRIRRDSSLKGNGLATAGLIIGYLILMLEVATAGVHVWNFSRALKQGIADVQQNLETNNAIVTQTQSTTATNEDEPIEAVAPGTAGTNSQQIEPIASEWIADPSHAEFPNHPANGKIHGIDCVVKAGLFRNGTLRITTANGVSLDITRGLGQVIEGHSYVVPTGDDTPTNPHVKMNWTDGGVTQSTTFTKGYGMRLQFDPAVNRTVAAKIYLIFPDDSKSYVAGTFTVRLAKPKATTN